MKPGGKTHITILPSTASLKRLLAKKYNTENIPNQYTVQGLYLKRIVLRKDV